MSWIALPHGSKNVFIGTVTGAKNVLMSFPMGANTLLKLYVKESVVLESPVFSISVTTIIETTTIIVTDPTATINGQKITSSTDSIIKNM